MKAFGSNVVVLMEEKQEMKNGFYMPDSAINKASVEKGTVQSVGDLVACDIEPGQEVYIKAEKGVKFIDAEKREYRIVDEKDILVIL